MALGSTGGRRPLDTETDTDASGRQLLRNRSRPNSTAAPINTTATTSLSNNLSAGNSREEEEEPIGRLLGQSNSLSPNNNNNLNLNVYYDYSGGSSSFARFMGSSSSPAAGDQTGDNSSSSNATLDQFGQCQSPTTTNRLPFNCTSQQQVDLDDEMRDFNFEQSNFSDFAKLWYSKDFLDILFRVAFVAPIVLLGIVGNLTIIYSMCKFKPFRTKPTNIFILNMAIADLLTTVVCPTAALFTDIYQFYVLGSFICRFEGFVKITCLLVSSYSLIVLSLDWLLCVVQPCRTRISIRQSWLALATIWMSSIIMASPLFVWRKLRRRIWKDLVEVWCCELIQYTKYYWVVITFFLIYLPTFFMTVVLVIILLQMDKFEAKLRKSRASATNVATTTDTGGKISMGPNGSSISYSSSNCSLSINMKYRRRIVKILFTYLLTSIICWTPLQFTIIYRHFRSAPIASPWFFELAFFAQLSASLTAAMNPIIFGFLSQPFRRIVAKSLMFKFFDEFIGSNRSTRTGSAEQNHHNNHARGHVHAEAHQMSHRQQKLLATSGQQLPGRTAAAASGRRGSGARQPPASRPVLAGHQRAAQQQQSSARSRAPAEGRSQLNGSGGHLPPSSKRVSFNTDTLAGRDNLAFEVLKSAAKITSPAGAIINNESQNSNPDATTSFMRQAIGSLRPVNHHQQRPISFVSMDSIDIERNLQTTAQVRDINQQPAAQVINNNDTINGNETNGPNEN